MNTSTQPLQVFQDYIGNISLEIVEDNKSTGRMIVKGPFQKAETKNANGRIYSSSLWEKVLGDSVIKKRLADRLMLGEVEHPQDGTTNLSRVSHVITKLERKGNDIIGYAEVLDTPSGKIVQELFRAGCKVGISSRGKGTSIIRNGSEYVDESNYVLDTFDFVYKPSTIGAFPELQDAMDKGIAGAYRKDSTMDEKFKELKRLDVRSSDIITECASADTLEALKISSMDATELVAGAESLASQLQEGDEHHKYAQQVLEMTTEAAEVASRAMEVYHADNSTDLDRRIDNVVDEVVATSEEGEEKKEDPKSTQKREAMEKRLLNLLSEIREERDFFKERCEQLRATLEESDDEKLVRLDASLKLGNGLLARLKESMRTMDSLSAEYEVLSERYNAAIGLLNAIAERQGRAKLVRAVREAIEDVPALSKFQKSLLECATLKDVEEKVDEFTEALGFAPKDKGKALTERVVVNAANEQEEVDNYNEVDETCDDNEEYFGENSELPSAKESAAGDEVLLAVSQGRLDENVSDPTVSTTRRVINRRGWK